MSYIYSGHLKTVLEPPNPDDLLGLDAVEISADELARWVTKDLELSKEWQRIPVHRARNGGAVRLMGRFEDIQRIDNLAQDEAQFWVPLSSIGVSGSPFPIDLNRYPIIEITYRCTSDNAVPAWLWTYEGNGLHFRVLPAARHWCTVARLVQHGGFPKQVNDVVIRLYSSTRTTESLEVRAIRFRAPNAAEAEVWKKDRVWLAEEAPKPKHYALLDEFLPLGVYLNADITRRLAETLGLSLAEYWSLALEDIAIHHHNCIAIENVERLTEGEWRELLALAAPFRIRIMPIRGFPASEPEAQQRAFIDTHVRPHATSDALLAWNFAVRPEEEDLPGVLRAKALTEEADPNHPPALITHNPGAYAAFAPHFPASGIAHFPSHAPWHMGEMVQTHAALAGGQQFWAVGPAFVYASAAPEWSTCSEQRLMLNLAFSTGARGWFSYAYHNDPIWSTGTWYRSLTGPFLAFSDLWLELDKRMNRFAAFAPLLLKAEPAPLPAKWYVTDRISEDVAHLPEGIPPASSFRLRGPDFNLYSIVSNDVLGMTSLNISIPPDEVKGIAFYDLSDFVQERVWQPMPLDRHFEMFPGQARVVLAAEPDVCETYRDAMVNRLIEDDLQHLRVNLGLARAYGLHPHEVEKVLDGVGTGDPMLDLEIMDHARNELLDLIYTAPVVGEARSRLIGIRSGLCACDGALCRLLSMGKAEQARDLGLQVLPLAREMTNMRLELRAGKGESVIARSEDLIQRTLSLLDTIRSAG
jgi:hypothetical protein